MIAALLAASGMIVGFTLGLLGSGGSIMALPLLTLLAGMDVREAIPTSLAAVGAVAAWGVARGIRQGAPLFTRPVLWFAAISSAGAAAGARLNPLFNESALLILFGALVLAAAVKMAWPLSSKIRGKAEQPSADGGNFLKKAGMAIPLALGVGVLSGLLGVGGGFLIVPALVLLLGVTVREAAPVSLLIIALNAGVGLATYAIGGRGVNLPTVAWFLAGGAVGLGFGQRLMHVLPDRVLRRAFALVFLLLAVITVAQKSGGAHGTAPSAENARPELSDFEGS